MMIVLGGLLVMVAMLPFVLRWGILARYTPRVVVAEDVRPAYRTAVVFGAAVRYGSPTTILRDRLDTAITLYRTGQVEHLILSGDGRTESYNEPLAMARYARQQGVPEDALTLDHSGLRTYDTCYRARYVYEAEQVVLVTQAFHLPRALFICDLLGIDAVGVAADQRVYRGAGWYNLREWIAMTVAAWDVLLQPVPDGGLNP